MLDTSRFAIADRLASERFYRATLGQLGIEPTYVDEDMVEWDDFSIAASDGEHIDHQDGTLPTEHLHLAFPAPDREVVEEFHRVATGAGYRDNGPPRERSLHQRRCYTACVVDPDGTSVEPVFKPSLGD